MYGELSKKDEMMGTGRTVRGGETGVRLLERNWELKTLYEPNFEDFLQKFYSSKNVCNH